jgi:hypothetical protein
MRPGRRKERFPPTTHSADVQERKKRRKKFIFHVMDKAIFCTVNKVICAGRIDELHDLHNTLRCPREMSGFRVS